MQGSVTEEVSKGGRTFVRRMNADREYHAPDGSRLALHGRSLLFVGNVGHLITTGAVLDRDGNEIPRSILDGVVSTPRALHDLKLKRNSRTGSIYIVKTRMDRPAEVAFAGPTVLAYRELAGTAARHDHDGIMDEERRTPRQLH
jgi:malate synthase